MSDNRCIVCGQEIFAPQVEKAVTGQLGKKTMTIKEHIDAGHYPKDAKGRPLVPMRDGRMATILATDLGQDRIWGAWDNGIINWRADGENWGPYDNSREARLIATDLMPPVPRKVEVKMFALMRRLRSGAVMFVAIAEKPEEKNPENEFWIEMLGSYTVPL